MQIRTISLSFRPVTSSTRFPLEIPRTLLIGQIASSPLLRYLLHSYFFSLVALACWHPEKSNFIKVKRNGRQKHPLPTLSKRLSTTVNNTSHCNNTGATNKTTLHANILCVISSDNVRASPSERETFLYEITLNIIHS